LRHPALAALAAAYLLATPPADAAAPRRTPPVAGADADAARPVPTPTLIVTGDPKRERLGVTRADIAVRVVGRLAETRLTLTFANPHERALAGDLTVPLPEGATVSGYALDVDGRLVDGVIVTKDEARHVFEQEVRKGVDPGIAEWVGGNAFRTRVFPIPAHGARTVAVRWVAELAERDDGTWYQLPLRLPDPVADLHLRVEVVRAVEAPVMLGRGRLAPAFGRWHDSWVAEATVKGAALEKDLAVLIPDAGRRPVQLERAPDGRTYFVARAAAEAPAGAGALAINRVRLVWDASRSREGADHEREIGLVTRWLDGLGPVTVDLVALRNDADPPLTLALPRDRARLALTLRSLAYDGATTLAAAALPPGATAPDVTVLISDGMSDLGGADPGDLRSPVFALNGDATANHALLRDLAQRSGGAYFNLARLGDDAVLARLGRPVFSLLAVRASDGEVSHLAPRLPEPALGPVAVAGVLEGERATLTLEFGVAGKVTHREQVTLRAADAGTGDLLSRFWAQQELRGLLARPEENAAAIAALGRAHGIVTPGTSLIVLERLEQYLAHDIRPPASLEEMRADWDRTQAERATAAKVQGASKLEHVLGLWEREVKWWDTRFTYPKGFKYRPEQPATGEDRRAANGGGPPVESPRTVERLEARSSDEPRDARPAPEPMEERARKKSDEADTDDAPQAAIALTKWDPETPYLRALKATAPGNRYKVYLEQRATYGGSPGFYLDCADLFAKDDPRLGLRVLSNVAELRLEDPALLRVLAHRLTQLERLDLAAGVFEVVLRLRPEEPQSYRDLALVLAHRARAATSPEAARPDYQRASELLARVVMGTWDRFDEIELIALVELNDLWPRAKAAGVAAWPLDPRLEKRLDMDVRIVMTWDADMTDMDLHVLEASDEEAYYGHNLTTIGGKVSRDFTQGYGPEEYSLRRAMHGTYKIKSHFYGSSAADLIGAVTLQVDVYTNFGRPSEKRRSLTFRLTDRKEEFVLGEIEL
jgi:hypothetical protein